MNGFHDLRDLSVLIIKMFKHLEDVVLGIRRVSKRGFGSRVSLEGRLIARELKHGQSE